MSLRRRRGIALAMLLCAVASGAAGCSRDAEVSGDASQAELLAAFEAGKPPLLLDVRTPEEYASGHVPGARNVPIDELPSRLEEFSASRGEPVVVYCERGPRASKAADALTAAGFTSVRRLAGSMAAWREAGLPVE